ncbi:MAG: PhoD-like phosphatase N-terminal domain-containing protein [Candidatus Competibacteraceae bacterium]
MTVLQQTKARPQMPYGVASGDILPDRAVIWSRTDRPSRMMIEYGTTEKLTNAVRISGPSALKLTILPRVRSGRITCRSGYFLSQVSFQDLTDAKLVSEPFQQSFSHRPTGYPRYYFPVVRRYRRSEVGNINPEWGGMKIYETMRAAKPDFYPFRRLHLCRWPHSN